METLEVFNIVQFAVPMYTALICGLLFFRMYSRNESLLGRKNIKWGIFAYALSVFVWLSLTLYVALPKVFAALFPLVLMAFMLVHVMYFRFIFELTRVSDNEKFSSLHYVMPGIAFLAMVIWSIFVPFDIQIELVQSRGVWVEEYKYYSMFATNGLFVYFVYDIVYALLGLYRTMRFRRVIINYSADEQRISFVWLYQVLFILLSALPMTIVILYFPISFFIASGMALLPVSIAILKDIILVHNILLENYVIVQPDTHQLEKHQIEKLISESTNQYDIRYLEVYMNNEKPYLNPRLKITDLTAKLNTNRTSLSILINRTYGMNFNRYVNRYRLEELKKRKSNPVYSQVNEMDLVAMCGFSDYRGYKRVKEREEIDI